MAALLFLLPMAFAGDVYEWTDENGTVHFSDSPNDIPPKYQDQFKTRKFKEDTLQEKSKSVSGKSDPENRVPGGQEEKQKPNRHEIPYEAYEGKAKRIIISVTFNDSVTAPMALDTGATGMFISSRLAQKLGVFNEDQGKLLVPASGIGGSAPAIRTIIDRVEVGGARDHFIPTTVTPSISGSFEGLIGMDFMSNYSIIIDTHRKMVVFEELPLNPDAPGGHDEEWWRTNFKEFGSLRTAWKKYRDDLDKQISDAPMNFGPITNKTKRLREFSEYQYKEADKLFDKLNQYARQYAVPMHWRRE